LKNRIHGLAALVRQAKGIGGGCASVSIAAGRICTLGEGRGVASVHALEAATGKRLWSAEVGKSGGSPGCTATVDGERLYAVGQEGDFVCVETATGKVAWRKSFLTDFGGKYGGWKSKPETAGKGSVAVTAADGHVYFRYESGHVALVEADPAGYREKSSFQVAKRGGQSWAHPVVSGGKLYLRENDTLWCYELKP
jgi:outer membrane protein assembly factor BamB